MTEAASRSPIVKMAGMIGRHFGISPLEVLNTTAKRFAILVAAYNQSIAEERRQEEARAKAWKK